MAGCLKSLLTGALLIFGLIGSAAAGLETRIGDNIYVVPDPKAKVVTVWMVVHAGCRDEDGGQCRGLAHYLEHLMFLGRSAEHEATAARVFAAGQTNAYTTMQATAYYQTAPVREGLVGADLDKLFALFADRLRGLDVAEDAAMRERNVVLQEFNSRRVDSVRSQFYTKLNRKLQPEHPISQQVIGTKQDIAEFTLPRAKAFHARWYARNNVEFVVYGPVAADDVKTVAAKYIDPLPRKKTPQRGWLDARRTFEPMDETLEIADAEIKRTEIVFEKIVRYEDPDPVATGASNTILFDFLNSQIKGSLSDVFIEQKKLASQMHISVTPMGAGVMWFSVSATLEDGVGPQTVKDAVTGYIADLAKSGLEPALVERLKKRRAAGNAETDKDPQRTLSALTGWFSGNRNYAEWRSRNDTLAAVAAGEVMPVLRAMAGPGRQIFGILSPQP